MIPLLPHYRDERGVLLPDARIRRNPRLRSPAPRTGTPIEASEPSIDTGTVHGSARVRS